ncbi:hypothetical protein GA0074704_1900 [Micromonospora siamensis]|uniref:Uncharacterized protein n=1 Tax=Micromonospora siamensis TaxID=299152 RepID=A0A1C5HKI9_9ACTN|nr:hypothetical protein GA0074704_1900 [Micromonospora siamensis]
MFGQISPSGLGGPRHGDPGRHHRAHPETYRCACGRIRDRCVRAVVRALWNDRPSPVAPLTPARPGPS